MLFHPRVSLLTLAHCLIVVGSATSLTSRAPSPVDFTGADWIWTTDAVAGEGGTLVTRAFRKDLSFPASPAPKLAEILLAVDDSFSLYVNGNLIDNKLLTIDYTNGHRYCVPVQSGKNVIAVEGHNAAGPAGLVIAIQVLFEDGTSTKFFTDGSWKASLTVPTGFEQPNFDDSGWQSAVVEGAYPLVAWSITLPPAIDCAVPPPPTTTPGTTTTAPTTTAPPAPPTPASQDSSSSPSSKHTGAIVGGTIGGVVGVGAVILALLSLKHIKYLVGVLTSALLGLFIFRAKQLVFVLDGHIDHAQITLFLTRHNEFTEELTKDKEKIIVWKVFNLGGAQRQFNVTVPCTYGPGVPEIGFGTVDDKGDSVQCPQFHPAPAWLGEDDVWQPDEKVDEKSKRPKFLARNSSQRDRRIAVGTIDSNEEEDDSSISPFLLLEEDMFRDGTEYHAENDLYLHVFRTVDYISGRYRDISVKDLIRDRISPDDGIKIKDLRPLTTWRIRGGKDGKLELEITTNSKKDVKEYKHRCLVKKDAKKVKKAPV